jgi:hypothetical protein
MPQGHVHHAREVCADCERHLRWQPKPSTLQRQKINELKLKRVAGLKTRRLGDKIRLGDAEAAAVVAKTAGVD